MDINRGNSIPRPHHWPWGSACKCLLLVPEAQEKTTHAGQGPPWPLLHTVITDNTELLWNLINQSYMWDFGGPINDTHLSFQIVEPVERQAREDRQMGSKKKVGFSIDEADGKTWLSIWAQIGLVILPLNSEDFLQLSLAQPVSAGELLSFSWTEPLICRRPLSLWRGWAWRCSALSADLADLVCLSSPEEQWTKCGEQLFPITFPSGMLDACYLLFLEHLELGIHFSPPF